MVAAFLLAAALLQPATPLRLDCSFTGEDSTAPEQTGPRRIGFTVEAEGARIVSVTVEDPTGIFTSVNVVGFVSAGRGGARYGQVPRDENPRWRGRLDRGQLRLTGLRREVVLSADPQGPGWSGRLHYEVAAGPMTIAKDGALSCRPQGGQG